MNYELCKKRLLQLKKQLDNKPELKKEYIDIIESQKISHMIEKVESSDEVGKLHIYHIVPLLERINRRRKFVLFTMLVLRIKDLV